MRFVKMHGIGNDYIYVNGMEEEICEPGMLAKQMSDRHFGVGADGLIIVRASKKADFFMEIYNADGSAAEMCGNGIRCLGKYVYEEGLTDRTELVIETLAGLRKIRLHVTDGKVEFVTADMGYPILQSDKIPVISEHERVIREKIRVFGAEYEITAVSMGNPHTVIFVKHADRVDLARIGPEIEYYGRFPRRTNVEFVEILDRETIRLRVWERGSAETLACGTGACAAVVASVLNDLTERRVTVKLKGGNLDVVWNEENGKVFMTGPAAMVYEGEFPTERTQRKGDT